MGNRKIAIVGGGAAGYFFASNVVKHCPDVDFSIFEQGKEVLQKVRISGGGRCNVTNSCSTPEQLIQHYPRGGKELLGPFHHFTTTDTRNWFEKRGVRLKVEQDGRIFPVSDQSKDIVDCLRQVEQYENFTLFTNKKLTSIRAISNGEEGYELEFNHNELVGVDELVLCTGSSMMMWKMLRNMNVKIIEPVPSLFSVLINNKSINQLAGLTVEHVICSTSSMEYNSEGPLLFTHKGLTGPAILKLSAFGAREFHRLQYQFELRVNFLPNIDLDFFKKLRDEEGKKLIKETNFPIPKRLKEVLLQQSGVDGTKKWASSSNGELQQIFDSFCTATFQVDGQNKFKSEFVTAGGVDLNEINMSTFKSKRYENMYLLGELLNIDAITGGFNFQAAWTGAYLAAQDLVSMQNQK